MKDIVLMEAVTANTANSAKKKKYKCPYCELRVERAKLHLHIQDKHEDMIPEGYTALRVAFNTINNKTEGHCIICKKETSWNEDKGRYERLCGDPKCKETYKKMCADRNKNKYGTERLQSDPRYAEEVQKKALAGRGISGEYKFKDGGIVPYVGSYEKKLLKFLDDVMNIRSEDIVAPGPSIEYEWNGDRHIYLPDFYYIPYNLIIEIKDGGDNPNKNPAMTDYKTNRQVAKENAVRATQKFNYIRLTNNDFGQLMSIMAVLKYNMKSECYDPVLMINEATMLYESIVEGKERKDLTKFSKSKKQIDDEGKSVEITWRDGHKFVGKVRVDTIPAIDGYRWFGSLRVAEEYRSYGLGSQILNYIIYVYKAGALAVKKDNDIAINLYKKHGFVKGHVNGRDNDYYYMYLKKNRAPGEQYDKYWEKKDSTNESALLESDMKSDLDKDHKQHLRLFDFDTYEINSQNGFEYVRKIAKRQGKKYWDEDCFKNEIGEVLVHKDSDEPIGYLTIAPETKCIRMIYVDPNYRGFALGEILLNDAIDKYHATNLWVKSDNKVAIRMYKKRGFENVEKDGSQIKMQLNNNVSESALLEASYKIQKTDGFYDNNGTYHHIVYIDGERYRERSEVMCFNEDYSEVFCAFDRKKPGDCVFPGGSLEKNETPENAGIRELKEEARIIIKDATIVDDYIRRFTDEENSHWNSVIPEDKRWVGIYNHVMYGVYDKKYNGYIKKNDRSSFAEKGKFYPVEEVYKRVGEPYKSFLKKVIDGEIINESYIINEDDIYYNKDKFDSGEINLCFIIGQSGSGKSSMASDMEENGVEKYELDDLQFAKDRFTMSQYKEYGDLIYSFFAGPGKRFYITKEDLKNIKPKDYEDKIFNEFIDYAKQYSASHQNKKFVIEGIEILFRDSNKQPLFKPSEFKDYAFYIKGTSLLISFIRANKRDASDADNKLDEFKSRIKLLIHPNAKYRFLTEKDLNKFRSYFKNLIESVDESNMSGTIGAALAPTPRPIPYESNKDNYYIVQHPQNHAFNYSITKDPLQYSMLSVDPVDKNYYKVFKTNKGAIDKEYLTFKIKDKTKAEELYNELAMFAENSNILNANTSFNDYIYNRLTGNHIISEEQILFDDRFELVRDFNLQLKEDANNLYKYFMDSNMNAINVQLRELEEAVYGK